MHNPACRPVAGTEEMRASVNRDESEHEGAFHARSITLRGTYSPPLLGDSDPSSLAARSCCKTRDSGWLSRLRKDPRWINAA